VYALKIDQGIPASSLIQNFSEFIKEKSTLNQTTIKNVQKIGKKEKEQFQGLLLCVSTMLIFKKKKKEKRKHKKTRKGNETPSSSFQFQC
jgi:acid phosphatase family membrane protein YuiD